MENRDSDRVKHAVDPSPDDEINLCYPKSKADLNIALCFPNKYKLGTSNLGFLSIYRYLNQVKEFRCERFYLEPVEEPKGRNLRSFETGAPLKNFDCLAFSLSFEIDLINIIKTILYAGTEVYSADRTDESPYIIMGGIVASINPEPAALFMDTVVLGDGEEVTVKLLELYLEHGKRQFDPAFQKKASELTGVYFPASVVFHDDKYGNITNYHVKTGFRNDIRKNVISDLDAYQTYSPILSPKTSFSSCCLIDVIRGCRKRCGFCVSGSICSPMRQRSIENITKIISQMKDYGHRFGLIAPSLTDHKDLNGFIRLTDLFEIEFTIASLRMESFSEELIKLIKKTDQRTITIAPEAGSERLRNHIRKPLSDGELLELFSKLLEAEIFNFKLYFMIGLPTERREDLEGIIETVKKIKHLMLKKARTKSKIGHITVSTSCFVPKPGTPFEDQPMDSLKELKWKLKFLKNGLLKIDNVSFNSDVPKWSRIQGMISKGDRKVGIFLKKVVDLDDNFPRAFKEVNINPDFYLERTYNKENISPWSHIHFPA